VTAVSERDILSKLRTSLLAKRVEDYFVDASIDVCSLIKSFEKAHGFMAGHVALASRILGEMASKQGSVVKFLAFTGNLVATGLRGIIAQLIREGFADAVITTCGAVDHDIARSTGHSYYAGDWVVDDSVLRDLGIHRLGNVYIPVENYGVAIEKFALILLDDLVRVKKKWSVTEILREAGLRISDPYSFLRAAAERDIPVFVPGIFDGAFGTQLVLHSQFSGLEVDIISDEKKLLDTVFSAQELGALIIGGGISKHHTIWFAQFKDGLDYAVYLTTAVEYDGSLSGAHTREAVSWGKIKPKAKQVVVYGDATITLPLIFIGAKCFLEGRIE